LKKCAFSSKRDLKSIIRNSNKEQLKAIVECVANSSLDSTCVELSKQLTHCKTLKAIKATLIKYPVVVTHSTSFILSEVLNCVLESFNKEDNESNSS